MKRPSNTLRSQMQKHANSEIKGKPEYDGNTENVISTGSTLLDLAISGGRIKGGGLPSGILVEAFGPESSGKTILLCECGGNIQRAGGDLSFYDPEARLNKQFAKIFDMNISPDQYSCPDTVTQMFTNIRNWNPKRTDVINGILADSLAALSTDLEMENDEGDKMGGRRAKEFSEQLRKVCRIIKNNNYLMICSNQVRDTMSSFGKKKDSPGGHAIKFYSSLRIEAQETVKINKEVKFNRKTIKEPIGIKTTFQIAKSSVWKPYRKAPVYIIFDYGIDDIRANLQFVKDYTDNNIYTVLKQSLDKSIEKSIQIVENEGWEEKLKFETIELWEKIEKKFNSNRKIKRR